LGQRFSDDCLFVDCFDTTMFSIEPDDFHQRAPIFLIVEMAKNEKHQQ